MKWDSHVDFVIRIATLRLYTLRILSNIISKDNLILIFHSLVRSVLEYCSVVLVGLNHKNSTLLEKIQRRAHHIICKSFCACNIQSLESRRILVANKLLLKASNNNLHVLNCIVPPKSQIREDRFIQPFSRTARRAKSFFPFTVDAFNNSSQL